jgi:hypothetical protein
MIIPAPLFFIAHVATTFLLAEGFPNKYKSSIFAFGVIQGIVEHYADKLPLFAALGPFLVPPAIGLFGMHYYFVNKVIEDKKVVWGGFISYFLIIIVSKGFDLGFPKDTANEQIEALSEDDYNMHHAVLHLALITCVGLIASNIPKKTAVSAGKKNIPKKTAVSAGKKNIPKKTAISTGKKIA